MLQGSYLQIIQYVMQSAVGSCDFYISTTPTHRKTLIFFFFFIILQQLLWRLLLWSSVIILTVWLWVRLCVLPEHSSTQWYNTGHTQCTWLHTEMSPVELRWHVVTHESKWAVWIYLFLVCTWLLVFKTLRARAHHLFGPWVLKVWMKSWETTFTG